MLTQQFAVARYQDSAALRSLVALYDLTKPRLAAMSVLSAMVAYATARVSLGAAHAACTLLGTSLAAGGALSLNQWWERHADAKMARTRLRPLPRGEVSPAVALTWSLFLSTVGVLTLAIVVNVAAAGFALATIVVYGLIYTPLKRRSRWATEVGAISGALPALLGNAAAGDVLARPGLALALLLLLWQMPHFFAIGWKHRSDYRAAGFPLLPAIDETGARTATWSFGYAATLLVAGGVMWALGWGGVVYGVISTAAGGWFVVVAAKFLFAREQRDAAARRLFFVSLAYLPLLMAALIAERFLGR